MIDALPQSQNPARLCGDRAAGRLAKAPLLRPLCAVIGALLVTMPLHAQEDRQEPLDEIIVSVTPVRTVTGLPESKTAWNVQTAINDDLERMMSFDLTDFMSRSMESVSLNDAQNNPLQPDLRYRGFTASPLLGLAQGLAVYQNGVRVNEPLGDTVNWDLLPQSAVHRVQLVGGANPLFGLNTLGGALSVNMKNGFTSPGHRLDVTAGSHGRATVSAETGGSNDGLAWYGNVSYFEEDGWRDLSPSEAGNFYGSLGWEGARSSLALNGQYGTSDLVGNGAVPVELLQSDREAIFTAPDITENSMHMLSLDGNHRLGGDVVLAGNVFYRRNETDSFNGDGSEFTVCGLGGTEALLEGLEADDLEELALEHDDVCDNRFADAGALEDFLRNTALSLGEDADWDIDDLTGDLSGSGTLSGEAVNNTSTRVQTSVGSDLQLHFNDDLFGRSSQSVIGAAWFRGRSAFDAQLELARLDPLTRSTAGLGTGIFVNEAATSVDTETETYSVYLTSTLDVTEDLSLTLSGRYNATSVHLQDRSGEQPELNGKHDFRRFNPGIGMTYQFSRDLNLYGSYSESSRAPTPIELACNDAIFELAAANAEAVGEDPEDVDFECRLPNAFLADPPLEQVIARSWEFGLRRDSDYVGYHLGVFHTTNSDDIIFQTTGRATGLFANVDETRRWGFESSLNGSWAELDWFMAYSYIDATFEDNFQALSPNHPFADDDEGAIEVRAGDRMPGIPAHNLKLGADYRFGNALSVGLDAVYNSGQYLRGDESNQLDKTGGYAVVNLRGRYRLNEHLVFFARISNLLDREYETFGLIGEEPSEVAVPEFAGFSNPLFLGPGAPRAAYVGLTLSL